MRKIPVDIVKMYPDAEIPKYQTAGSAGCDVKAYLPKDEYPDGTVTIWAGETKIIPTGLKFALPDGWEMQIRPRSGVSSKTKLRIANSPGTLDGDYRGELKIIIDNILSPMKVIMGIVGVAEPIVINHGDRIAQLVINEIAQMELWEKNTLDKTERGEGGLGHTGTN
jgi:dUTP pyrophosphatase